MELFLLVWAISATVASVWLCFKTSHLISLLVESVGLLLELMPEDQRKLVVEAFGRDLRRMGVKVGGSPL